MSEKLETEHEISIGYDDVKQLAILGHLIQDPKFFVLAQSKIKPEWFRQSLVGEIYSKMLDFYNNLHRAPTEDELRNHKDILLEDQQKRNKLYDTIHKAKLATERFGLDALRKELTEWLQSQLFEVDFRKAYKAYTEKQEPKLAYTTVEQMVEKIRKASFLEEREEAFADIYTDIEQNRIDMKRACTFGLDMFDRLLLPDCKNGSLLPGDLSIVLAPSNVGKTTSCITTIVANIKNFKKVLFITHEGRKEDIKQKIRECFLDKNSTEIMAMAATATGLQTLRAIGRFIDQHLTYIHFARAGLTVEEVAGVIRNKNEQLKLKNNGVGYDLLVDDYPAKLTTEQARGGQMSRRNIDDIVYNYFVQLAGECQFHAICPIQTNREGSKINKGITEDRLLVSEDVMESWGPITAATNVWTANRSLRDKQAGRITYFIDKSRSSETGFAVVCKTNFSHAITHSNELGATFYRGSGTYADKLDTYLKDYIGMEFPDHLRVA